MQPLRLFLLLFLLGLRPALPAQPFERSPIEAVQAVADKTLRTVPFAFRAILMKPGTYFRGMQTLNFGRSLGLSQPGLAYAYSVIRSERDARLPVGVSHNDGLKVWLNGEPVYEKQGQGPAVVTELERSFVLSDTLYFDLKQGDNEILVKSTTTGENWKVYFQPIFPPVPEGQKQDNAWLQLSTGFIPHVTPEVAELANWFFIGPFSAENGLATAYPPEAGFVLGRLYQYGDRQLAWELPKVEILADVIDADPLWGTLYDWNYHTAGYAWAIHNLGEYTGEQKYLDYLSTYCDFMLDIKPYVGYEKYVLNRPYSRHTHLHETPLLDFTSAPAIPFIYRLRKDEDFARREAYAALVEETQDYLANEQVRMPDGTFTRETPFKYTTWVDDMYMGIPFLIQSALLTDDPAEQKAYFDEAAEQVLGFHQRVYDPEMDLYMHAQYSERPEAKLPYWSRANGWGIWAVTEVLLHLPQKHPHYKAILQIYRDHVDGLVKWQNPQSGFYHNVLNRSDSFEETSGTAIFTMAIARGINQGWLKRKKYEEYVLKGWKALDSVIAEDGTVGQVCMGTMCSEDVQYYFERPVVKDDSHGLLGLIFAGIEVQKLVKE